MNRRDAYRRLLAGISADLAAYAGLEELLEQQFHALLAHDAKTLQALGARIETLVADLDLRRAERVELAAALGAGEPPRPVERLLEVLPPATREAALQAWRTLETRLQQCRRRNTRNCELLMGQHARLIQLNGGESDTYAPA
ncbi:flagellar protein FlgN [Rubrivivax sp. JA1026]|uniref:flagellar protein FlgN n=1 Tax=Rubrivivax sp. JA1026 TaxID=2710888 RepID=UPI0013E952F0|nr:flagellar protein FlgN [Rubrivivax sp. JA1026]